MDYTQAFAEALKALKDEGRYRVFADIRRDRGRFPAARHYANGATKPITVWCSNDYLGMAQHPAGQIGRHHCGALRGEPARGGRGAGADLDDRPSVDGPQ